MVREYEFWESRYIRKEGQSGMIWNGIQLTRQETEFMKLHSNFGDSLIGKFREYLHAKYLKELKRVFSNEFDSEMRAYFHKDPVPEKVVSNILSVVESVKEKV